MSVSVDVVVSDGELDVLAVIVLEGVDVMLAVEDRLPDCDLVHACVNVTDGVCVVLGVLENDAVCELVRDVDAVMERVWEGVTVVLAEVDEVTVELQVIDGM